MRMIDGDEVLNIIAKYCPDDDGSCSCAEKDLRELLDEIEAMPTVEAENTELAAQIMRHYGAEHQQLKLCEECGELIQATIKAHEIGADITTDFVGELADVYVLIEQFIATMPTVWRAELDTMVSFKLRRQIERIENESL